jgi:hypothetical protein
MFGAALVLRRSASQRDRLLGFLSISTGVFIAGAVMYTTRAVFSIPALGFVHEPILFTCAPLLYLYVRECLEPIGLQRRDALHFLPALVCLLVLIPAYATTGVAKITLLERAFEGSLPWYVYRSAAVLTQAAIYITLVLLLARRAKPALRESSDDGGVTWSETAGTIERNAVDLDLLSDLTDADLEKLGVHSLGHRKRLLKAVAKLNETKASPARVGPSQNQRAPGEAFGSEAERGQLTVVFCDLAGSTALFAEARPGGIARPDAVVPACL